MEEFIATVLPNLGEDTVSKLNQVFTERIATDSGLFLKYSI